MIKKRSWLLMLILPIGLGQTAFASHGYINVGAGGVFSSTTTRNIANSNSVFYAPTAIGTSLFTLPNIDWKNQFNNGYGINVAVGKYFDTNWHGDLEFLYQNIARDIQGSYGWREQNPTTGATYAQQANNPISKTTARADIYAFMTNASYDLTPIGKLKPFLSTGLGGAWLRSNSTQTNDTLYINDPSVPLQASATALQDSPALRGTALAWQLKAGVDYAINEKTTAILQYRLFKTSHFQMNRSTITTNPGKTGQTVFYTGKQALEGLLTQAIELNLRFDV